MATRIDIAGTETAVYPRNGKAFTLAELYEHVDCETVEAINLGDGRTMWLDEEGKMHRPPKPVNPTASALLHAAGGITSDYVVGTVLITEAEENDDEDDDGED